ncbi:MAG: peptide chain release factor-like protein [Myxococcales bacterium]|nr:MAG: peptide chain release factor-like protein [Myxococcales bacterium]
MPPISQEKIKALEALLKRLGIEEADLLEKFVRGSGPGGQKINKTSVAVYLRHLPSGIEVKVQQSRSQATNRFLARRELADRLIEQKTQEKSQKQQRMEKVRRQKRKRSKRAKEKILADKHHQSEKKKNRKKPGSDIP